MEESHNLGYEHRYEFRLNDPIIPRSNFSRSIVGKIFVFEVRTKFIFRPTEGEEEIMGSERLLGVVKETNNDTWLHHLMLGRLMDYWLSVQGSLKFTNEAMAFAREKAAYEPRRDVIPVVVDFDVCTLQQQQGEAVVAALDRAIRPENMVPIYVSSPQVFCGKNPGASTFLLCYLIELDKTRVKNVDEGLKLMDVCRICGRIPTLGTQISHLKCKQAFHSHCVVNWLLDDNATCPVCGAEESPVCGKRSITESPERSISVDRVYGERIKSGGEKTETEDQWGEN